MRTMKRIALFAVSLLLSAMPEALAQNEQKDLSTMAAEAADNLARMLKLEDWQIYQVDSTYQYNFAHLTEEYNNVHRSGASNSDLYRKVTDRWYEACDTTFHKIFNEEQWQKYLRTEYGKALREREKRQAKQAAKKK